MKDLICFFIYAFCLRAVLFAQNTLAYGVIIFITIVFCLKYFRKSILLEKYDKGLKAALEKQRKIFANTVNHDLKVPIIAQMKGLQLLNSNIAGSLNQSQQEIISNMEQSCKYTLNMISMLEYPYKYNNSCISSEPFNIQELIILCFNKLVMQAKEKNISFVFLNEAGNNLIYANKKDIKKVILNMLSNAIQYSNNGSEIEVCLQNWNNKLKFIVSGMDFLYDENGIKNYSPIGHNIEMLFCKKILEFHKGRFFINIRNGYLNSLSFIIPQNNFYHIRKDVELV